MLMMLTSLAEVSAKLKPLYLSSLRKRGVLLLSTAKDISIGVSIEIDGYNFEVVKDFIYLGSSISNDNDISLEIRRRIILANRCYFGLRKQLSKSALSWRRKICLYKSLI